MRTAVITPAAGRHRHLTLQHLGLAAGSPTPDLYLVVAMDDPGLGAVPAGRESAATVFGCPVKNGNLPPARARNLGAARAVERGAELLVFLDVGCVPGEQLLERYRPGRPGHRAPALPALRHGGEDTDYGQRACAVGVPLTWVGGAPAFHQYYPVSDPPVAHLRDILRNAETFSRRCGGWPMTDWLQAFADRGLAHGNHSTGRWALGPSSECRPEGTE